MLKTFSFSLLCVAALAGVMSPAAAQTANTKPDSVVPAAPADSVRANELPDSPGALLARAVDPSSESPAQGLAIATLQQSSATQPQSQTQQNAAPQKPVGTAAAEAPNASGVAASQPAGVAIAPAKQRRARTIVIRVGAIIAAGAAVGTVVALTAATSSKPPGTH
ncbi:MAG: hypothetical protein WBX38_20820 [Candidatus Sulfotelmatobacter sp.]